MKEELRTQYVKSLESRIETINSLKTKFYEGNEIADRGAPGKGRKLVH